MCGGGGGIVGNITSSIGNALGSLGLGNIVDPLGLFTNGAQNVQNSQAADLAKQAQDAADAKAKAQVDAANAQKLAVTQAASQQAGANAAAELQRRKKAGLFGDNYTPPQL